MNNGSDRLPKKIYQNKIDHHFNVTNIEKEFLLLYGEVAEAFDAYKKNDNIGDELADVAIYLLGLSEYSASILKQRSREK